MLEKGVLVKRKRLSIALFLVFFIIGMFPFIQNTISTSVSIEEYETGNWCCGEVSCTGLKDSLSLEIAFLPLAPQAYGAICNETIMIVLHTLYSALITIILVYAFDYLKRKK